MVSVKKFRFLVLCTLFVYAALVEGAVIPLDNSGWVVVVSPSLLESGEISVPYIYGVTADAVVISNSLPDGGQLENVYYSLSYGYTALPIQFQLNFVDVNGSNAPSSPPGDNAF